MLKQQLNFKLSQKLSPQQIQLMKLIQLPTQAFEQKIKQELEENPALDSGKEEIKDEFDEFSNTDDDFGNETIEAEINVDEYLSDDEIPDYRLSANNYSVDDEDKQVPYASGTSFNQYLKTQLNTFRLSQEERDIAEFIIGSLDESGYLRRSLEDLMDDLAFTQNVYTTEEKIEDVLFTVQELDPSGVAARNLEECLILQLSRKTPTKAIELAIAILEKSFDHFSKKHYKKLMSKFSITEEELKDAIQEIEHLNPKPGGSYASNTKIVEHVVPDFTIRIVEGELELTLNGRNAPELRVSRDYSNCLLYTSPSPRDQRGSRMPSSA